MSRIPGRDRAPFFDQRDPDAVLEELARYAEKYLPDWREFWPADWRRNGATDDPGLALFKVFGRLAGVLIERLNEAPEKQRLAFYDFLGVSELGALPARVPLVFETIAGLSESVLVPRRTEVTGGRENQASAPVIFATEQNLRIAPGRLNAALFAFGAQDAYADLSTFVAGNGGPFYFFDPARPRTPLPHVMLIGLGEIIASDLGVASQADLNRLSLSQLIAWKKALARQQEVAYLRIRLRGNWLRQRDFMQWFVLDAAGKQTPVKNKPRVEFLGDDLIVTFEKIKLPELSEWRGDRNVWLGVRAAPFARKLLLPEIRSIDLSFRREQKFPDAVFQGRRLLSEKEGFLPFGKKPEIGDCFYIGAADAFTWTDGAMRLEVRLEAPVPLSDMRLRWDYWDGKEWTMLGLSAGDGRAFPENKSYSFYDGTNALTANGVVTFRIPAMRILKLHHKTARWLRVTLLEGRYNKPGELPEMAMARRVFAFVPPTVLGTAQKKNILEGIRRRPGADVKIRPIYFAPKVSALRISYESAEIYPASLRLSNNFEIRKVDARQLKGSSAPTYALTPYVPFDEIGETKDLCDLFLGVEGAAAVAGASLSILFTFNDLTPGRPDSGPQTYHGKDRAGFVPRWSYFAQGGWWDMEVRDIDAKTFLHGGIVKVNLPSDATQVVLNHVTADATPRFWIRLSASVEQWRNLPISQGIFLNGVMAVHSAEYSQRLVGSGTDRPDQSQRLHHVPLLGVPVVQVREKLAPDNEEIERITQALARQHRVPPAVLEKNRQGREVWVTWTEVTDFALAGPTTRCYIVDRESGVIRFGDGRRGMSPPRGPNNIRASYTSGGGRSGNVSAGQLKNLRTYVRGVQSVNNPIDAAGGTDRESTRRTANRAAQALANQNRAVTVRDFEEIAGAYSRLVERAHCIRTEDGRILIAVLPGQEYRDSDANSTNQPHPGLLAEVEAFVKDRAFFPLRSRISVIAPRYISIGVRASVVTHAALNESAAENLIAGRLRDFLNPFTGSASGVGWNFGETISVNRVAAFLQQMSEVERVVDLKVYAASDPGREPTLSLIRSALEVVAPGPINIKAVAGAASILSTSGADAR